MSSNMATVSLDIPFQVLGNSRTSKTEIFQIRILQLKVKINSLNESTGTKSGLFSYFINNNKQFIAPSRKLFINL